MKPGQRDMPLLDIRDVSMSFGGLEAIHRVNFGVAPKDLVGIIGPNGAGKTTLFNLITGFYPPDKGEIWYNGENITNLPMHKIAKKGVSRVFQINRIFLHLSVMENLVAGQLIRSNKDSSFKLSTSYGMASEEKERGDEILELLQLSHRKNDVAGNLPYGEQRRVAIGIALMTEPVLLLLDEPAIGMNPLENERIMGLIVDIRNKRGITILIVEHNMKVIMGICDRVIVLNFGKIIADGSPGEIANNQEVIKAYLGGDQDA